jgi:hypothetical protein
VGRLFTKEERPKPLALAAANGGAALIGVALPRRFDDAMRIAVVRRYRPCPTGLRVLCLSLVMLGLIDSVALAPLALAAVVSGDAGSAGRAALAVVAVAGAVAFAVIVALPHLVFVLLGALGIGYSFSLALVFLCAGAAAAALPIGPAGGRPGGSCRVEPSHRT